MATETADGSMHLFQIRNQEIYHRISTTKSVMSTFQSQMPSTWPDMPLLYFAEIFQSKAHRQWIHATEDSGYSAFPAFFESIVFESFTVANLTHRTPESSRDGLIVSIQVNLAITGRPN